MLTSLKLLALMAITTSLLAQPTSADHPPDANWRCSVDFYDCCRSSSCTPVGTCVDGKDTYSKFGKTGLFQGIYVDGDDCNYCEGEVNPLPCNAGNAGNCGGTFEDMEAKMHQHCNGGLFNFDPVDKEKCGCVGSAPTARPFVFLGKAEAAGAMKSVYLAYTSALNGSLQHYIADAARRLAEEARGSTERVCVVLVDLLHAGLNSELVDLEAFTDFYGKVIEELGCSDV